MQRMWQESCQDCYPQTVSRAAASSSKGKARLAARAILYTTCFRGSVGLPPFPPSRILVQEVLVVLPVACRMCFTVYHAGDRSWYHLLQYPSVLPVASQTSGPILPHTPCSLKS